jgi:hypothetical protein
MSILALIPLLILVQASFFDMEGAISDVYSPTSLKIDNTTVYLEGVDPSGLNYTQNRILMRILDDWLVGKDVFVKDNYAYFDLGGSYNSISINEMIQNRIQDLKENFRDYYYR